MSSTRGTSVRGRRALLALGLAGLALVLVGVGVAISAATAGWGAVYLDEPVAGVVLALVGGLLASRVPRNPIGWIFLGGGLAGAAATLANAVVGALGGPEQPAPGMALVVALGSSLWMGPFLVAPLLLLLFPDGRLRSPRWRAAVAAVAAGGLAVSGTLGIGAVVAAPGSAPPLAVGVLALVCVLGGSVAGIAHLALRARDATGDERQQLRWLLAGGALTGVLVAVAALVLGAETDASHEGLTANEVVWALALLPIPVATGVAVLRHRLYDLGRLISRTVAYSIVTTVLLGVYFGLVTGAALLTPASRTSPPAVAASTLAAVALFRPLRSTVQQAVERRFDRRRYDAQRVAERYRAHVRGVVDLAEVTGGLVDATHRAVQPAGAGLWLRTGPSRRQAGSRPPGTRP